MTDDTVRHGGLERGHEETGLNGASRIGSGRKGRGEILRELVDQTVSLVGVHPLGREL